MTENSRERWAHCFEGNERATPFSRPEWLWPCGDKGHQAPLTLDWGFGFAPLYLKNRNTTRTIRLMGGDYEDIVSAPGRESDSVGMMMTRLRDQGVAWDICDFRSLLPESVLLSTLTDPKGNTRIPPELESAFQGLSVVAVPHHMYHRVLIPDTWQEYEQHLGKNFSYQIRAAEGRRKKQYKESFIRIADASTIDADLDALYRLHTERWQAKGQSGFFPNESDRERFTDRCKGLLHLNQLRLYSLWLDGVAVGAVANFVDNRRIYYYATGFDAEYGKNYPMKVLIGEALKDGLKLGPREFDFMKGEEEYKLKWANSFRMTTRLVVAKRTPQGLSALAVLKIQSRLKEWKQRKSAPNI